MRSASRAALLITLGLAAAAVGAADAPTLLTAREIRWTDLPDPTGAKHAQLWGDANAADSGLLVRWKFNTKVPNVVRDRHVHILVLAGTFTIDLEGRYKEFGPGGYLSIPRGVRHSMGCEAAGECTFLVHETAASQ